MMAAKAAVTVVMIVVALGAFIFIANEVTGTGTDSSRSMEMSKVYSDLKTACSRNVPQDGHIDLGDSRETITVCGDNQDMLCMGDIDIGGDLQGCDSIEIESGCSLTGSMDYTAVKRSTGGAVVRCG